MIDNRLDRKDKDDEVREEGSIVRSVNVWPGVVDGEDSVAKEVAVAMVYNGISHAVMMASPLELEAFALGFSLTEGIVDRGEDIYSIDINRNKLGIELSMTLSSRCLMELKNKRRNLSGRTGCGICGAESLQQVHLTIPSVSGDFSLSHEAIDRAAKTIGGHQPLQASTGAIHAAAWCNTDGKILHVCEDIGRHNALDKLIGSMWQRDVLKKAGFLLISSRASYEMIQKAGMAGIAVVAAVSAPTSLAIDIAEQCGLTLIGFSRVGRHVVYANKQRLQN